MTINLKDVGSGYKRTAINDNFTDIENELNTNVLTKDGGQPLTGDLDMNSNQLLNVADGVSGTDAVNVNQLNSIVTGSGSISTIVQARESQLGSDAVANVFTLTGITYAVGVNTLAVFRNGQRLEKTVDYTETSTTSVTLTFTPNASDRFVFITNDLSTSDVTNTAAITHTDSGTDYNLSTYLQDRVEGKGAVAYNIPTDFADLQSVFDSLAGVDDSRPITVNIEAGHALTGGLELNNKDHRNVTITSDDVTVFLDPLFSGVDIPTAPLVGDQSQGDTLFIAVHSYAPRWQIVVDMQGNHGSGYCLSHSEGHVDQSCGVINAGYRGAQIIQNSNLHGDSSVFDGAQDEGIRVQVNSMANIVLASFNNCKQGYGDTAAVYISKGCLVDAREVSATGSGSNGMEVRRSFVVADEADCSNATLIGLQTESAAHVNFTAGVCNNSGGTGIKAQAGAIINAPGAVVTGSGGDDLSVSTGAQISTNSATTTSGGAPAVEADCSVQSFNVMTGDGFILANDAAPSISTVRTAASHTRTAAGTVADFLTTKYANGVMTMTTKTHLDEGASGAQLISPTIVFPESFDSAVDYTVDITPSLDNADWGDTLDRDKVSVFGTINQGVSSLLVLGRALSGQTFSTSGTADNVDITITGKWK